MCFVSFIIPTRNRSQHLAKTLAALGALDASALAMHGGAEVVIVDNASMPPAAAPAVIENGMPVRMLYSSKNLAAAARNLAAQAAHGSWLVMLDDDSHPIHEGFVDALAQAPKDAAAIAAEIFLPSGAREAGGLPEVFVGCAAAIRAEAFADAGGYDQSFGYYVEEYDLCAKLMLAGGRIVFDRRFQAAHRKTSDGRDMHAIVRRLTRNNARVAARYAPRRERWRELRRVVHRYGAIALKERAELGWLAGLAETAMTLAQQPRREMSALLWDRFTGLAHARNALQAQRSLLRSETVRVAAPGKNAWAVVQALRELGVKLAQRDVDATTLVIGALSPGPMLDAWERISAEEKRGSGRRVVAPWLDALQSSTQPHDEELAPSRTMVA